VAVEDAGPVDRMKGVAAAAVRFLPETFLLRDGRQVLIRGIESRDSPLLAEFYAGLCEGSRRLRFLGYMAPLSGELVQRLVTVDFRDRIALVATAECDGRLRLVADCRLAPVRPGKAEIAIAVADDFQNAGLGRALLQLMLGLAARRRLQEVVAEVRYDNTKMMRVLRSVGFRRVAWEQGIATFVYRYCGPGAVAAAPWRADNAISSVRLGGSNPGLPAHPLGDQQPCRGRCLAPSLKPSIPTHHRGRR
jgi:RimJ/RimL family protein N-acetyltransferase